MNGAIKRSTWVAEALLGYLVLALSAQAASFDCGKAASKVEKLICADAELSKLDDELNAVYKTALQDGMQADTVKQAQKRWMKERNDCADAGCVKRAYEERLHGLTSATEKSISKQKTKPRFTVTEGKGWAVCESYAKFLNTLPESEPLPLCHLKRSPDFPDLKDPDWEEIEIPTHLELVYSIEKILSPSYHDRPVDTFDHWKAVYEQQIRNGEASPRLRRTHLALIDNAAVETILAYEPDRYKCDKGVEKKGYAFDGALTSLFIWNEQEQKIEQAKSHIAFSIPYELMLYQGRPLLFFPYWGGGTYPRITGGIAVNHFIATGEGTPYGHLRRCEIGFELTPNLIERMTK